MKFKFNEDLSAELSIDNEFIKGSSDNINPYQLVYLEDSDYRQEQIAIRVNDNNVIINTAIISAGLGGIWPNVAIAEKDRIVFCCGKNITCLSIPELKLLWQTKSNDSVCFCIYPYQNSYIIHGEMNISRIDENGNLIWQQSGGDIFVNLQTGNNFLLTEDCIFAIDFNNNHYKFAYDGKIIND